MTNHPSPKSNLFFSHSWQTDAAGRNTHERVRALKREMQRLGWTVWFDEDRLCLGSSIDAEISAGVRSSDAICVCVTRAYIDKVNAQYRQDYCVKEFNLSMWTGKRALPLVMEPDLLDMRNWPPGVMSMYMGSTFYLDATSDRMRGVALRLSRMLELLGIERKRGPLWKQLVHRRNLTKRVETIVLI